MADKNDYLDVFNRLRQKKELNQENTFENNQQQQLIDNQNKLNEVSNKTRNWWQNFMLGNAELDEAILSGLGGVLEGIVDAGANLIAGGAKLFGADNVSNAITDFSKRNLVQEGLNTDFWKTLEYASYGGYMSGLDYDEYIRARKEDEIFDPTAYNILSGVGSAIGYAVPGSLGAKGAVAGATMFSSALGSSSSEALNDNADIGQALAYGTLSGSLELATEKVTGGILKKLGVGAGNFAGVSKKTLNLGSNALKSSAKVTNEIGKEFIKNAFEEGVEEVVSELVNPLLKIATYEQEKGYGELFNENGGIEGVVEAFLGGAIGGAVLGGANTLDVASKMGNTSTKEGLKKYNAYLNMEKMIGFNQEGANALGKMTNQELLEIADLVQNMNVMDLESLKEIQSNNNLSKNGKDYLEAQINKMQLSEDIQNAFKDMLNTAKFKLELRKVNQNLNYATDEQTINNLQNRQNELINIIKNAEPNFKNDNRGLYDYFTNVVEDYNYAKEPNAIESEFAKKTIQKLFGKKTNVELNEDALGSYYDYENNKFVFKPSQTNLKNIVSLLGHEEFHAISSDNIIKELGKLVGTKKFESMLASKEKEYNELTKNMSYEDKYNYLSEEVAGDLFGDMLASQDGKSLNKIFSQLKANKLQSIIRNLKKLKPRLHKNTSVNENYNRIIELAQKNLEELLKEKKIEKKKEGKKYKIDSDKIENAKTAEDFREILSEVDNRTELELVIKRISSVLKETKDSKTKVGLIKVRNEAIELRSKFDTNVEEKVEEKKEENKPVENKEENVIESKEEVKEESKEETKKEKDISFEYGEEFEDLDADGNKITVKPEFFRSDYEGYEDIFDFANKLVNPKNLLKEKININDTERTIESINITRDNNSSVFKAYQAIKKLKNELQDTKNSILDKYESNTKVEDLVDVIYETYKDAVKVLDERLNKLYDSRHKNYIDQQIKDLSAKKEPKKKTVKAEIKKETIDNTANEEKPVETAKEYVEKVIYKAIKGSNVIRKTKTAYSARLKRGVYYTQSSANKLIKFVNEYVKGLIGTSQNLDMRVQFNEKGKEVNLEKIFKILNNNKDNASKVDLIIPIIAPAVQIKIEGKWKQITDESLQLANLKNTVIDNIREISNAILEKESKPTELEKEISKIEKKYSKKYNLLLAENTRLKNRLEKMNAIRKDLRVANKENIKLTKQAEKLTNKIVKYTTDAEGKIKITSTLRRLLNDFSEDINYKVSDDIYIELANKLADMDIEQATKIYVDSLLSFKSEEGIELKDLYTQSEINTIEKSVDSILREFSLKAKTSNTVLLNTKIDNLKSKIVNVKLKFDQMDKLLKNVRKIKNLSTKKNIGTYQGFMEKTKIFLEPISNISRTSIYNKKFRESFLKLSDIYDLKTLEYYGFSAIYSDVAEEYIKEIANASGPLTTIELEKANEVLNHLIKASQIAKGEYETSIGNLKGKVWELSKSAIEQQSKLKNSKYKGLINSFLDPRVVMEIADGYQEKGFFTNFEKALEEGRNNEVKNYFLMIEDLFKFSKTKEGKQFLKTFKDKIKIKDLEMTKGEWLSFLKVMQREQGRGHLLQSGLEYEQKIYKFESEKINEEISHLKALNKENDVDIDQEELNALKEQQNAYKDQQLKEYENEIINIFELNNKDSIASKYMNEVNLLLDMAKTLKEQTDKDVNGITNVKEEDKYFPIRVSDLELQSSFDEKSYQNGIVNVKNYHFNKNLVSKSGAITLGNINNVIQSHAKQMASYSAYAKTITDFGIIYNYRSGNELSLGGKLKQRTGEGFEQYINELLFDVQGSKKKNKQLDYTVSKWVNKLRSNFAKYSLYFNGKVIVSQLSSIPAARKYISFTNLTKAISLIGKKVPEMPPLTKYRNIDGSIMQVETLSQETSKFIDKLGAGITGADRLAIKYLWRASLIQTMNKDGTFNLEKANELILKVVSETQPNYDAIHRSGVLRSESDFVKMCMMFMTQRLKNLSNAYEAVSRIVVKKQNGFEVTKEDYKMVGATGAALFAQGLLYSLIGYAFKFLRDEDKDELTIQSFIASFFKDTVLGMIPLLNQFEINYSSEKGFGLKISEIELGALTQLNDILNQFNTISNDGLGALSPSDWIDTFGKAFGIPTRNLYNYTIGLTKKWFPSQYEFEAWYRGYSNNKTKINDALRNEKEGKAKVYYNKYNNDIVKLNNDTNEEMFRLYKKHIDIEGNSIYKNVSLKNIPESIEVNGADVEIDSKEWNKYYNQIGNRLDSIILSNKYKNLTDEEKATLIAKLSDTYYNIARKQIIGESLNAYEIYIFNSNKNISSQLCYLTKIGNIKATKQESRKQLVEKYINKLPISKNEKYLLYFLSGYKLSETQQKELERYLKNIGINSNTIKEMFE